MQTPPWKAKTNVVDVVGVNDVVVVVVVDIVGVNDDNGVADTTYYRFSISLIVSG